MSESLDPRDALLRRLLLDEPDPLAAFARSELAGDASARAELEELLDAERRVRALAADEREARRPSAPGSAERAAEERVLERLRSHLAAQATDPKELPADLIDVERRVRALAADEREARRPSAPGSPERAAEERVLEHLRAHVGAQADGKALVGKDRKPRAHLVLLLAAALALFLGWRWMSGREAEPDPDTKLGAAEDLVIDTPLEFGGAITWKGQLAPDGHFVVRVLDAAGGEVDHSDPLVENRWTPTEEAWQSWPDEIRIIVESRIPGPDGLRDRSPEVRAQRSR